MTRSARRIAVVNWRDPWHRDAGGAETYAWQVATRLAAQGDAVTYLTARDTGQARTDHADGVRVVRLGGRFGVYPRVLAWLAARRGSFDGVVDCQNGIPFFTPWVTPRRVPVVCVVHHVHDRQFGEYLPPAVARFGRFLEGPVARRTYRRRATAAVSPSTVQAMRARLDWPGEIHLVPNGTEPVASGVRAPAEAPTIVCVGRLVRHKRIDLVIEAAVRLREDFPGLVVRIVGKGPDRARLERLAGAHGLADTLRFEGFVTDERKAELLSEAWLHVAASAGEGWGLGVVEAAAHGVPTVAPDVDGLRDSVRDGITGWLAPTAEAFGETVGAALKEVADPVRRAELDAACREWAGRFDWDSTARRIAALLDPA
ncbi:glycosyltransferase involved in cell wall biosynthesis [Actinocorallia herbida]|uniref:Glycosyltransferase involved in cell wall biosynthesis n=1 Tax=Actinocorallia herbida TaxID=58109 RepID=A0A3N1D7J6_9ACTN|nr:glycosyltransferase family 4 protein [Actinocorallia herbida]ROO89485.1 glycosyltransferase involved in cell wall biosynthesis [Actinocorallia herbida]